MILDLRKLSTISSEGKEVCNVNFCASLFQISEGRREHNWEVGAYSPEQHQARIWGATLKFSGEVPAFCFPRPRSEPQPKEGRLWKEKLKRKSKK